jgi:hypothetical protein
MDVALDTNIYITDPHFNGSKFGALIDYLAKTRSSLIVPKVVKAELAEVLRRQMVEAAADAESAFRRLDRYGVSVARPDFAVAIDDAIAAWDRQFNSVTKRYRKDFEPDAGIIEECVRRATRRVPPCGRGNEMRDALIWLGFVDYLIKQTSRSEVAFISSNTKDYCEGNPPVLHRSLQQDLDSAGVQSCYFPSLDAFLKDHAAPIQHLTEDWVKARTDYREIAMMIEAEVSERTVGFLEETAAEGEYTRTGRFKVTHAVAEMTDLYVWEYETGETRIFVTFAATVDAEVECENTNDIYHYGYSNGAHYFQTETDIYADVLAEVVGDDVRYLAIEELGRL